MVKVAVKQGVVCGGESKTPDGVEYEFFRGIPYAKPPVGPLRFKAPQPLEEFSEPELDCTKERDIACQRDPFTGQFVGSENCLYLNVYRPKILDSNCPIPVLFWIHGGGFMNSSGNAALYSPEFLIQEDVIVVTFNYRLAVLGFLSIPEAGIYGNYGLKDQLAALKWVQENISPFGGDPNNVTIFGQSAGASSVGIHLISEKSRGLFHKAILQSGNAFNDWAYTHGPEARARKLAFLLGCHSDNLKEIAEFLQNVPVKDLVVAAQKTHSADFHRRGYPPLTFAIVIEEPNNEAILTQHPSDLYRQKDFLAPVPIISGSVSNEGYLQLANALKKIKDYNEDYCKFVGMGFNLSPDSIHCVEAGKEIREFFFGTDEIKPEAHTQNMANFMTDYHFNIAYSQNLELVTKYQTKSPLYLYYFDFEGELNFYKKVLNIGGNLKGCCHSDEVAYLFRAKMFEPKVDVTSKESELRRQMCKLWTNFAKFGEPTPKEQEFGFKWEPVSKLDPNSDVDDVKLLKIGEEMEISNDPTAERRKFWRRIYKTWNNDFVKVKL